MGPSSTSAQFSPTNTNTLLGPSRTIEPRPPNRQDYDYNARETTLDSQHEPKLDTSMRKPMTCVDNDLTDPNYRTKMFMQHHAP